MKYNAWNHIVSHINSGENLTHNIKVAISKMVTNCIYVYHVASKCYSVFYL